MENGDINVIEENMEEFFHDFVVQKVFLTMTKTKEKSLSTQSKDRLWKIVYNSYRGSTFLNY